MSADPVRVLLYHRLVADDAYAAITGSERVYSIAESRFAEQVRALGEHGYTPVGIDDVTAHVRGEATLAGKPVLITFDDGCASVATRALPILARERAPALLFVATSPEAALFAEMGAGQERLDDDQIRALDAGGVAIGSHSVSHVPLEGLPEADLEREVVASKEALERVLGKPVRHFGVPFGDYGPRTRAAVERAGYETAFTSEVGLVAAGADPFALPRINVDAQMDLPAFLASLEPGAIAKRRRRRAVRQLPARVLGPARWRKVRRAVLGR